MALHYLDDLPVADVAATMEVSDGTVKYHLHHARERLRASWTDGQPRRDHEPPRRRPP